MDEQCFYCYNCANVWIDNEMFLHDIVCPDCESEFMDDDIDRIEYEEYLRIVKYLG